MYTLILIDTENQPGTILLQHTFDLPGEALGEYERILKKELEENEAFMESNGFRFWNNDDLEHLLLHRNWMAWGTSCAFYIIGS